MKENREEKNFQTYYQAEISMLATFSEITKRGIMPNARECWMSGFWADDGSAITISVEDNGSNGDGLTLSLSLWGTGESFAEGDDGTLVGVRLTPKQAMMLARALEGVCRMREFDMGAG